MSCDAQEQHEGISGPFLSNHGPGQKSVLGPLLPFFCLKTRFFFKKKKLIFPSASDPWQPPGWPEGKDGPEGYVGRWFEWEVI